MADDENQRQHPFGPQNKPEELWSTYPGKWVIIHTQGNLPDGLGKVERIVHNYAILNPFVGPHWDDEGELTRKVYYCDDPKGEMGAMGATVPLVDAFVEPTTRKHIENHIKGTNAKQKEKSEKEANGSKLITS